MRRPFWMRKGRISFGRGQLPRLLTLAPPEAYDSNRTGTRLRDMMFRLRVPWKRKLTWQAQAYYACPKRGDAVVIPFRRRSAA